MTWDAQAMSTRQLYRPGAPGGFPGHYGGFAFVSDV